MLENCVHPWDPKQCLQKINIICSCPMTYNMLKNLYSSVGAAARCGLWPVEQHVSIFPYLPQSLSIFSLPALEDLFPLLLSILSWVFLFVSSLPVLEWRFLGILSSSILSRWPSQLILCPFIYFTIFSSLLISSSSRFVLLFQLKICIAFKINWIENMKGIFF